MTDSGSLSLSKETLDRLEIMKEKLIAAGVEKAKIDPDASSHDCPCCISGKSSLTTYRSPDLALK